MSSSHLSAKDIDSLLVVLDSCIEQRYVYEQRFVQEQDSLWRLADEEKDPNAAVKRWTDIETKEFRYKSERAIRALNKATAVAKKAQDKQAEYRFAIRKAEVYGMLGIPWEAKVLLDSVMRQPDVSAFWRKEIYAAYYNTCAVFRQNVLPREISDKRMADLHGVEDSLQRMGLSSVKAAYTLDRSSNDVNYMIDVLTKNFDSSDGCGKAVCAAVIADKYALMGDDSDRDYYWALSAIYGLRNAQYEIASLGKLAKRLFELGDIKRATRYALAAYENAELYGVNQNKLEAAAVLQKCLVRHSGELDSTVRAMTVWKLVALLLVLCCCVLAFLYYRNHIRLKALQVKLDAEGDREKSYIEALKSHVEIKDEYVTRFLELSLDAVYEVEQLRRLTLMRIKSKEYDRLQNALTDPKRFEAFQKECLLRFDLAFLRLYPDFARQVNRLLLPDEQLELPDKQLLNNELRILAFMKLGVTDGSKIATILGISVNTLYFYRNRFRRRAIDRDAFESSIMAL